MVRFTSIWTIALWQSSKRALLYKTCTFEQCIFRFGCIVCYFFAFHCYLFYMLLTGICSLFYYRQSKVWCLLKTPYSASVRTFFSIKQYRKCIQFSHYVNTVAGNLPVQTSTLLQLSQLGCINLNCSTGLVCLCSSYPQ